MSKEQFDEFLGGTKGLPDEVNILKLATARASEIAAMTYSIENPQRTKLIFQKLPVHMRRRVMSHNTKRMPRRLREAHERQMAKSGLPPKNERPSRKYRRRPSNLLAEYERRRRDKAWLETHIWHAKRFHMTEKWSYKIADRSNDRCFKANYRAVAKHCLVQDISYYSCIEITGPVNHARQVLKEHCNPNELTFGAKIYTSGCREGTLMFFKKNGYPESPLGTVHFLWKPDDSGPKTIWIWVHPSFYSDVLSEITSSFEFVPVSSTSSLDADGVETDVRSSNKRRLPCTSTYSNDADCKMVLLKNSLNRFRLCGPLSLSVLTDALRLPELECSSNEEKSLVESSSASKGSRSIRPEDEGDVEMMREEDGTAAATEDATMREIDANSSETPESPRRVPWYIEYYKTGNNSECFGVQKEFFRHVKTLQSPNQLPPNVAIALTVLDPRFFVPEKRRKTEAGAGSCQKISVPPKLASRGAIWDEDVRNSSMNDFLTTSEIDRSRSKNLVPGMRSDSTYDEDVVPKIPILLIQRPGCSDASKSLGFSSGIDIVLPAGWAMAFWLPFILRCAKPGGLRESKSIIFENSTLNSPDVNPPDTPAYAREAVADKLKLTERYFRYPPNRRVNFVKLAISSPFFCEWRILTKEWSGADDFYVLRDRDSLETLRRAISRAGDPPLGEKRNLKRDGVIARPPFSASAFENENCLIAVKVSIRRKGRPEDLAVICMPAETDLKEFEERKNWSGPVQATKTDRNEAKRKALRREHLAFLKRSRRRRVRCGRKIEDVQSALGAKETAGVNLLRMMKNARKKSSPANAVAIGKQARRMRDLYLPECTEVRNSCDRQVMGYVTQGAFSYSDSRGVGIGYVALKSLLELIERETDLVLVRNTRTRQYRMAGMEILPA